MNIEELSKSQLILLTILVNFVTSVATGILTVSLLDQASPVITKTVNQVVEHTIETVAQAAPAAVIEAPAAPAPSTQDLVTNAIALSAARLAWVYDPKTGTSTDALALGTYLPKARAVVTTSNDSLPKDVLIEFADGSTAEASLSREGNGITIYGFADTATLPSATAPALLAAKNLKLGETVLAIGSDGSASTGIVSRVADDGIHTTLSDAAGAAAVDLNGDLMGIAEGTTPGLLISSDIIYALLTATSSTATSTAVTAS
jgi:hypothetical protein